MNEQPIIAITGASGLLGRPLFKKLSVDNRYQVSGSAFSRAGGSLDQVDLLSQDMVKFWLEDRMPSIVIHLAAERRPDVYTHSPGKADKLNIEATGNLSDICAERKIPILFLSTNYVFDGKAAPYYPDDVPKPLNAYGRSKRAGELLVTKASTANRTLRIPMLYGPSDNLVESSVTVIAKSLQKSNVPVPLDIRQTRYPAFTPDVASAIIGLLPELLVGTLPGPYLHFCPGKKEAFTKREMGEILAPYVGTEPDLVVADGRPPSGTPRPENVQLACPGLEALGLVKITPFREAIALTMASIRAAGGLKK